MCLEAVLRCEDKTLKVDALNDGYIVVHQASKSVNPTY